MLKLKKMLLAMMVAALAVTGFVSCSDDDDDDTPDSDNKNKTPTAEAVDAQTDLYGTYTGTMTVGTKSVESTVKISADGVDQGGNYGSYTKVLWLKDTDGNYVIAAQSDSTNTKNGDLTVANYTTAASCYITFGDTITYTVPAMKTSMTLTKLPYTVDAQTDLYGTYTGTMTVGTKSVESTVKISADGVDQGGNYGAYTKVLWLKDADGNYVVAAQSDSTNTKNGDLTVDNYTTASSCYITFGDTITYTVPAMKTSMTLTKNSGGAATKTLADYVAATYTVDQNGGVYQSLDATTSMAATSGTGVSLTVTKTDDAKVTVTIPEVQGNMMGTTMTIPSFDVTDVTVASATDGYTLSIGTYDSTAISSLTSTSEPVFTTTLTVDNTEKAVKVYGLIATVSSDGKINLQAAYKYGVMPFPFKVTFATATATTE